MEKIELHYDSKADTLEHIKKVNNYLIDFSIQMLERAKNYSINELRS